MIGDPIDIEHGMQLTECKTPTGSIEWHIRTACGPWPQLNAIFNAMFSRKLLLMTGLISDRQVAQCGGPFTDEEAHAVRVKWFEFGSSLIGYEVLFICLYRVSPPGCFVRLVSKDREEHDAGMVWLKKLYLAVEAAEELAKTDAWMARWLDGLLWRNNPWVMEKFTALAETEFTCIPQDQQSEFADPFKGVGTKDMEDSINELRRCCEESPAGNVSTAHQWWHLQNCGLFDERGYRPVQPTKQDYVGHGRQSLPKKMFNAGSYLKNFSLGDDAAKLLVGNSFTCPNADNFMKQCIRTSALEWAHGKEFEKLKLLWTNKLFVKGTVVSHREGLVDNIALLVVSVSEYGFIGWRVRVIMEGGIEWVRFTNPEAVPFEIKHVEDPEEWTVIQCEPVHPSVAVQANDGRQNIDFDAYGYRTAGTAPQALLDYNALNGFRGWTCPSMLMLLDWMPGEPVRPKPVREADILAALLKKMFTDLPAALIQQCLETRKPTLQLCYTPAITAENKDLATEAIEAGEDQLISSEIEKQAKRRKPGTGSAGKNCDPTTPTGPSSSSTPPVVSVDPSPVVSVDPSPLPPLALKPASSAESSSHGPAPTPPPPRRRPPLPDMLDIDMAREYMPEALGASLSIHTNTRWIVKYMNRTTPGPKTHSRTWDSDESHRTLFLVCMRWVWERHKEATGKQPVWDFSEPS